jgi:hypothetical protein
MSRAPRIHGMADYPELEKKYQRAYRVAAAKSSCGGGCDTASVLRLFKQKLEERQGRDKPHDRR